MSNEALNSKISPSEVKKEVPVVEIMPSATFTVSDIEHDESGRMYDKEFADRESDGLCYFEQRGIQMFDGRPFESRGFVECHALLVESPKALSWSHVEPNGINGNQARVLKKFFSGLGPVQAVVVQGKAAFRPEDSWYHLGQMKIDCASKNVINAPVGVDGRWGIICNQARGKIFVAGRAKEGGYNVNEYSVSSIFSEEENAKAQKLFESRDYMPLGFRFLEKYFSERKFKIGEYSLWEKVIDVDEDPKTIFTPQQEEQLFVWNPRDGLIEMDYSNQGSFADLVREYWVPPTSLLVVRTLLDKNMDPKFMKGYISGGTIGSAVVYEVRSEDLYMSYILRKKITNEQMMEMWKQNEKYRQPRSGLENPK
ncbi:MAG: hypothetical protein WC797_00945 [Candidatus Paceibacterota bacterium]|jgi:hypothetical protein